MKDKKSYPVVNIGTASILTVFVILAMVTFATLTYMTARKDARFNQKQLEAVQTRQEAVNQAYEKIAAIDRELAEAYKNEAYEDFIGKIYSFTIASGEDKVLEVSLTCCPPQENQGGFYRITRFQEVGTKEWNSDDSLNLLDLS